MDSQTKPKELALSFLRMVTSGKVREAYAQHIDPACVFHNPYFGPTAPEIMQGMVENNDKFPDKVLEVKQALAEGDRVAVHSRLRFSADDEGVAVVHIFRFKAGKIVEMWDVAQQVPKTMVNRVGMF